MAQRLKTDWILFLTVVVMMTFGMVMVYSASSIMAQLRFHWPWHFVLQQSLAAVVAILVMMTLKKTDYTRLRNSGVAFGAIGVVIILLAVVYVVDGANHRWLRFGMVGLQPSELAKPALAVFLAYFVTWRARAINTRYTLFPAALAVGFVLLAVIVADFGTAVVLGVTAIVVFLVAGLEWRYCAVVAAIGMVGGCVFIASKPYRLARVVGYVDPEQKIVSRIDTRGWLKKYMQKSLTSRDTGYQAGQSKIAVGAGGLFGQGLMQGRQKLLYLPEAHTDFIYAVVAEEMGLLGSLGLLAGFGIIFWRGIRATFRIQDDFGRYLALGITVCLVFQAFLNISVVLGMLPTKGIPLPLISSGGSSLVSSLASLGILMNVSEHAG